MNDLDVDMAIWCIFPNATLRAAVHPGKNYEVNLRYVKSHHWKTAGLLECADAHEALSSRPRWGVKQSRNPGRLCNESVCLCLS